MFKMLTRMFAGLTFCLYALIGYSAYRFFSSEKSVIEIDTSVVNLVSESKVKKEFLPDIQQEAETMRRISYEDYLLIFEDQIRLHAVYFNNPWPENLVDLYRAPLVQDQINTGLAAAREVENEVVDKISDADEPVFIEPLKKNEPKSEVVLKPVSSPIVEEVAVDDMISFNYTQPTPKNETPKTTLTAPTQEKKVVTQTPNIASSESHGFVSNALRVSANSSLTIHAVGSDFKKTDELNGFEVRYHDDYQSSTMDQGSGLVTLLDRVENKNQIRMGLVLKPGFIPTHADLIIEEGSSETFVPLIEKDSFDEIMGQINTKTPVGAVLVDLHDETADADLDVPYKEKIRLDGDLKKTLKDDHRYLMFTNVRVGNTLLSYKNDKGILSSKLVHVHERELTFDQNFYDQDRDLKIKLFEEDLLSTKPNPLAISSEKIREFSSQIYSTKLSLNSYKFNLRSPLLGTRSYLELNHLDEPIFLGLKNQAEAYVPSDSFISGVMKKVPGAAAATCVVQVNLSKPVKEFSVASQSVEETLEVTYSVLDEDGKFYDSTSEKTRKIFFFGETQAQNGLPQEGMINIRLQYANESVEYLNSYCAPNTYLVEQL